MNGMGACWIEQGSDAQRHWPPSASQEAIAQFVAWRLSSERASVNTASSGQDPIEDRWLAALLQFDSTLPRPIAQAMIQNVLHGPLGDCLRHSEGGLLGLESVHLGQITGSEARTVLAILLQMNRRILQLQANIQQLWSVPGE